MSHNCFILAYIAFTASEMDLICSDVTKRWKVGLIRKEQINQIISVIVPNRFQANTLFLTWEITFKPNY